MRLPAIGLLVAALMVGGCASKPLPPVPTAELEAAANHRFDNLTQEEFYAAAERVLELADGDDFKIDYNFREDNQLFATREYFIFAVIVAVAGTHWWDIRAVPRDGGIDASIHFSGKGQIHDGSTPRAGGNTYLRSVASYTAFWERVDFVLGRSDYWPTCDDIDDKWEDEENPNFSSSNALCHASMKDIDPRTGEATNEENTPAEETE